MSNNPFTYNGGVIAAMAGKNCVSITCDTRLGANFTTVSTNFVKVFKLQDNILLAVTGLASDVQTFAYVIRNKLELYRLRENKDMKVTTFVSLVSKTLFEHRFSPYYINPIVVGLEKDGTPVISSFDSIGSGSTDENIASAGSAEKEVLGMLEAYYEEDMDKEKLEDILGKCVVYGVDRNIRAGWGAITYTLSDSGLDIKCLKVKQV